MNIVARAAAVLASATVSLISLYTSSTARGGEPEPKIATFSVVVCDPATGEVGAAVASMYPAVGKVVPFVKAGAGAFCTQHYSNAEFGPKALVMLETGMKPEEILTELLRHDPRPEQRQLGIIDMQGRMANHNPTQAGKNSDWWGYTAGKNYAVQGNTLAGREVLVAMAKACEETEGSVGDKLMAALKAGDDAGGDHRGRLAAGIRVDRPQVDGEPRREGVWLAFDVDKSDNAVNDLLKLYEDWKAKPRDE